jgi:hypothetical protein
LNIVDVLSKKNTQISDLKKICPVGAKVFSADTRTDEHDKVNSSILNFAEVPRNQGKTHLQKGNTTLCIIL